MTKKRKDHQESLKKNAFLTSCIASMIRHESVHLFCSLWVMYVHVSTGAGVLSHTGIPDSAFKDTHSISAEHKRYTDD